LTHTHYKKAGWLILRKFIERRDSSSSLSLHQSLTDSLLFESS